MGAIPLPPQKTIGEHTRTQAEFLREKLEPVLTQARAKRRAVFFVGAAHLVQGSFLRCVWCLVRMFVRGASGRRRYNVLGAWNGATRELIRVTNDTRVSSDTVVELLGRIAMPAQGPTTSALGNARYRRCAAVEAEAQRPGTELLFLPSYSPDLNVIERLWEFTKKRAGRGRHYADVTAFRAAIDDCLDRIATDYKDELRSLMTLKFQTFDNDSFLAA